MEAWVEEVRQTPVNGSNSVHSAKSSKMERAKSHTCDGARILRSGAVYRQKFDAEVQLADGVTNVRYWRENKPLEKQVKSSRDTSLPVVRNATYRGMLENRAVAWTGTLPNETRFANAAYQRQVEEVQAALEFEPENITRAKEVHDLPDVVRPAKPQSNIIERMQEKRREKHNYTMEEFHQELSTLNTRVEPRIAAACDILNVKMGESERITLEVLEKLQSDEILLKMPHNELMMLWESLMEQSDIRRSYIEELDENLAAIEDDRVLKLREVMTYYCDLLDKISHMAHADLHRLIDDEAMNLNQALLSNRRSYADLFARLMMHNIEKEKRMRTLYVSRFEDWQTLNRERVIEQFLEFMDSDVIREPPSIAKIIEEMRAAQEDCNQQRNALLDELEAFKPPNCTKTVIYKWNQRIMSLSKKLDQTNQDFLKRLYEEYENVCQQCLREMDLVKGYLIEAGVCNQQEAGVLVKERCLKVISERQAEFEQNLASIDKALETLNSRVSVQLKSLFKFAQGVGHIWDRHELGLAKQERRLQEQLEEGRKSHDQQNQDSEATLDIIMDKMRQDSSESHLKESLKKAIDMLEKISGGYFRFHDAQIRAVQEYPNMVHEEFEQYNQTLCGYFGLQKHLSEQETAELLEREREKEREKENLKKTAQKKRVTSKKGGKKTPGGRSGATSSRKSGATGQRKSNRLSAAPSTESASNATSPVPPVAASEDSVSPAATVDFNDADRQVSQLSSAAPHEDIESVEQSEDAVSRKLDSGPHPPDSGTPALSEQAATREVLSTTKGTFFDVVPESTGSERPTPEAGEEAADKSAARGIIIYEEEAALEMPLYAEKANVTNQEIVNLKVLIRLSFLDHLDDWQGVCLNRAQTVVTAKCEELESELRLRLHLHEPRPRRAELDVHNVRAAELVLHSERVTRHTKGISQTVVEMKQSFGVLNDDHDELLDKFRTKIESLEDTFTNATKSTKLISLVNGLQGEVDKFMESIRKSLRLFRQQFDNKLQMLREANSRFIKSFRLFSEGGNFCPEEVDDYRKRLDKMSHKIDQAESTILSELEGMEKKRLQQATKVTHEFEDRFKHHMIDLIFMEKIARFLTNTQVKIKAEVADSNSQAQKLAHALMELDRRIDAVKRPNLDKEQIDAPKLNSTLPDVFKAFHDRSVYLNCVRAQKPPPQQFDAPAGGGPDPGAPVLVGPAGSGMRVMFSEPTPVSRAGRQPAEDPSVSVIKNILRTQKSRVWGESAPETEVEEPKPAKQEPGVGGLHTILGLVRRRGLGKKEEKDNTGSGTGISGSAEGLNEPGNSNTPSVIGSLKASKTTASRRGSNATLDAIKRQPSASRRYVTKNQRLDKKYMVFGEGEEDGEQVHLLGRVRRICREALDGMLIAAELYYRQKGNRTVTRPQALQETFDQCADVIINKLQSYFNQTDEYHNTCLQEFRGQLEKLEYAIDEVPELVINHLREQVLAVCRQKMELHEGDMQRLQETLEEKRATHEEQLRPSLGHPNSATELEALMDSESQRHSSVLELFKDHKTQLQSAVLDAGTDFAARLSVVCEQLFLQFDNLLTVDEVEKGRVDVTRHPTTELMRRKQDGRPLEDNENKTLIERGKSNWPGLPLNEFVIGSQPTQKCTAAIVTAKTTMGHLSTDKFRHSIYQDFKLSFDNMLKDIDEISYKNEIMEQRWFNSWEKSVAKVKALY